MHEVAVSVIIPTLRRNERLRELLGSLERQTTRCPFEIIVVANLPEPGLKKVVESYGSRFRFLETGRLGANIARNKGLERARGDVVVFLDDDCYVGDKSFLERIYALHVARPEAIAIGGRYALKAGANTCETAYHIIADHWLSESRQRRDETLNLIGGCCSFKAHLLGPKLRFQDSIIFGGTETELFERLREDGFELHLIDELRVEHRLDIGIMDLLRKGHLQGVAASRRGLLTARPRLRHWHATISLRESAAASGIIWTRSLARMISLYSKAFDDGFRMGANTTGPAPAFTLSRFLYLRLAHFGPHRWRRWVLNAFLMTDRARAVVSDERATQRPASLDPLTTS